MRRLLTLVAVAALACNGCQKVTLRGATAPPPVPPQAVAPAPAPPPAAAAVPAPGAEDAAPPAPAPPSPPSRLGVLAPLSGRYAAYGKAYLDGAMLAAQAFNERGPGKVEIVPADAKTEPLAALAATRRLIEDERLVAILGSVLAMPTAVAALEANCNGVPLLSNVSTEDAIGGIGPYVFHAGASRQAGARAGAELAALGLRRFRAAVLYPEEGDGRALAEAFSERFAALGGEVVFSEAYPPGSTDFTTVLRRLAGVRPEILYLPAGVEDMLLIAPALAFNGIATQLLGTEEWNQERLLRGVPTDLEGALIPSAQDEANAALLERFRARFRSGAGAAEQRLAGAGWLGATQLLDVLAQHPRADRETMRRELEARRGAAAGAAARRAFFVVHDGEAQPFDMP
jgi:branched-chain amino acid transport system substrate-binding protein